MKKVINIALIGNPNSGKSSLFNSLTGLDQKIANFPGVTVDKRTGKYRINPGLEADLLDLPGIISINPRSIDEEIAVNIISGKNSELQPDIILYLADASNLKRSLFLYTQLKDIGFPIVMALNMNDIADKAGISIDFEKLSELLKCKIIIINARTGEGTKNIRTAIDFVFSTHYIKDNRIKKAISILPLTNTKDEIINRYNDISGIIVQCIVQTKKDIRYKFSDRLDKLLTHPVWGYLIFLTVMFVIFQSTFKWASYPMHWFELFFSYIPYLIHSHLPGNIFFDLLADGIIPGLGGVIMFIPQILLLFAFITILEDTGYMARASFIMDRIMRYFGLNGKSVVPMVSGFACAVPSILSARIITNWKERLITIFIIPFMSCSARLPVYTILITMIIPDKTYLGLFNLQGITLMGLYLIGFVVAIFTALLLKKIIRNKEKSYFVMELPVYKMPRWKNIGFSLIENTKIFIFQAGKVILAISIVLWFLASFGPEKSFYEIENKTKIELSNSDYNEKEIQNIIASNKLKASFAGILGRIIEPVIVPLGFDWKIGIALITSFAAREVFVGTLSTIYSIGRDNNDISTLKEKLKNERNEKTGLPVYTLAVSFSLMIFYAFAMQCMSTFAVVYRETKGLKWPTIQFIYMTGLAYFSSLIVFNLLK